MRVLDFGCGWGSLLLKLPRRWRLHGYDLAATALEGLKRACPLIGRHFEAARVLEDGQSQPKPYDLLICSHVLEHVEDDMALLGQLRNAMSNESLLLVNVPIHELAPDPRHVRSYTPESLERTLRASGLNIISMNEMSRISGWVRSVEIRRGRLFSRPLRLLLSLFPYSAWLWIERVFLKHMPTQHLVALATRAA